MTAPATATVPGPPPAEGMAWVPAGTFLMGSEDFYPEEAPVRATTVEGFWMDAHPVTVREYRRFVQGDGLRDAWRSARSTRPTTPTPTRSCSCPARSSSAPPAGRSTSRSRAWWHYVPGACWHRPDGPGSDTYTRGRHPVTQVAHEDAAAYAAWAGKALPTEAEWERAARGGLEGRRYAWGDEEIPGGRWLTNVWQGEFPWRNTAADGHLGTSPVGSFPANGYGLHDMTGNVWEWTCDVFTHPRATGAPCCAPPAAAPGRFPSHVIKGGSHLCAPSYCLRYRPAARQAEEIDTSTTHLGFRCVVRGASA